MKVHIFGATSSPSCCTLALKHTAIDNKNDISEVTFKTIMSNFYMDDCLASVAEESEAIDLREELYLTLKKGGMNLTKWSSNSASVLSTIPEEARAASVRSINLDSNSTIERTLGVQWNISLDAFSFERVEKIIQGQPVTRRGVLSVMSSIFDPLGFVCPTVLPVKIILRDLCKLKVGWDYPVPEVYEQKWTEWLDSLSELTKWTVPRCLQADLKDPVNQQLHHFSDASESGYGCVTYMRTVSADNGTVKTSLVMAKSHVAPLKTVTIPRMELTAATLSVRVDAILRKELQLELEPSVFWTDSTAVLKYINNDDKRFHTFVANRISVIRDSSDKSAWRYVDSPNNPADDASRGLTIKELVNNSRWVHGPSFLQENESHWPSIDEALQTIPSDDPEVKNVFATVVTKDDSDEDPVMRIIQR